MNKTRLRVGLNGFGRIGRAIFRINRQLDLFDVVAVNDLNPDPNNVAYLLKYDSTYGPLSESVRAEGGRLCVGEREMALYSKAELNEVPWAQHGVDVVIEASGASANAHALAGYEGPIGHLVHTQIAPDPARVKTVVFGVNEEEFDPRRHRRISSSICDTIALAPIIQLIESGYGIETGSLTTLHPWLTSQRLIDSPAVPYPQDPLSGYALARSAADNLIPKSTTAVLAADDLFPGLTQKIESFSFRTPTNIVGGAVLNLVLREPADQAELIQRFLDAQSAQRWKVFNNEDAPTVSIDFRGSAYSVNIDQRWTSVRNGRLLRMVYWYDNEWGYASRVVDLVGLIGERLGG